MTHRQMTIAEFRSVLEDVLDETGLQLAAETTAKDIANWDSLNNVRLLVYIEKLYGIDLPIDEVERAGTVGGLLNVVNRVLVE